MISLIMLTHNANQYNINAIETINKTQNRDQFELIVVDNNSDSKTKKNLVKLYKQHKIQKLVLLDENKLFAKGNNIGVAVANEKSDTVVLINSDIEIKNSEWLWLMKDMQKENSVVTLGFCAGNPYDRGDGYCFMISRKLYDKFKLDEDFEWFWSITKLQAQVLNSGHSVCVIKNHENILHHFGGASGKDWDGAKGMDMKGETIIKWFNNKAVKVVNSIKVNDTFNISSKKKLKDKNEK